jgi:DNA-binding NtrC family response regulator
MKSILLIDDTIDVLENLRELLIMEGYEIGTAINGEDAFNKLVNFKPDLIITDLRMPKMDGFTFLEKIKSMDHLKFIPVLLFSGDAIIENMSHQIGAVGFLKKPCNTDLLLTTIQTAFNAI